MQHNAGRDRIDPALAMRRSKARIGTVERVLRITGVTASSRFEYLVAPRLRGSRTSRGSSDLSLTLEYLVAPGTSIRKGERVAEFDREAMRQRVDDLRAAIIQQEATMRRMNAALTLKREQLGQRLRAVQGRVDKAALDLKTAPVRSAMQIERYQMALEEARAIYQQTLAEVPYSEASEKALVRREEIDMMQARRELEKAELNLASMVYHAPIDGFVVLKRVTRGSESHEVEAGEIVGPGLAFGEIVDTGAIIVNATISQADAEQVNYGLKARVHFDAFPDIEVPGRLTAIAAVTRSGGQRAQYVREVPVRLDLEATEKRVIPNLSVNADIVLESVSDVVVLPKECVFRDEDRKPFAMVETDDGWEKRQLELGLENHLEVAVRTGVKDGETVAAEPLSGNATATPPK